MRGVTHHHSFPLFHTRLKTDPHSFHSSPVYRVAFFLGMTAAACTDEDSAYRMPLFTPSPTPYSRPRPLPAPPVCSREELMEIARQRGKSGVN